MVFSSLIFLFIFLPVFFAGYYLTPNKYKNITALLGSYFFYAWGAPKFVVILFFSSVFDYILSQKIISKSTSKKTWLTISLVMNIGLLAYFKYANFFVDQINLLLSVFGSSSIFWTKIVLPIGISFFVFQKISYVVDVYRGKEKPADHLVDFLLYVALFPQLIAGPIVRYHDIAKQLKQRVHSIEMVHQGIFRFTVGLSKKVLIANPMGTIADSIFALSILEVTSVQSWIAILAYTFQIYFDFSGYSDMAIGLGKMMGFNFLENFNAPYISKSISEFWTRWHISLSRFMREYVYIPLGGNRISNARTYINLWTVFLISGIWHGANWTYIVWGMYHGFFIMLDKMLYKKNKQRSIIFIPITFFIVMIGWVFFRSPDITYALQFIGVLFSYKTIHDISGGILMGDLISNRSIIVFITAIFFSFISYFKFVKKIIKVIKQKKNIYTFYQSSLIFILLFFSVISLMNSTFNPFIYFQF